MIFTEPVFLIFFVLTFALYWLLKGKEARLSLLLVASMVFYGWWDWRFLGLIGWVIVISWACARIAGRMQPGTAGRRILLAGAITSHLGVLATFKYFGFFSTSAAVVMESMRPNICNSSSSIKTLCGSSLPGSFMESLVIICSKKIRSRGVRVSIWPVRTPT